MSIYEVGQFRENIGNYFFEVDSLGNIHVYTKDLKEYLDMIDIDYKLDRQEFILTCKKWIVKNGAR